MEPDKKYPMSTSIRWTQTWPELMNDTQLEILIQDMLCEDIDCSDAKAMLENIGIKCNG